MGEESSEDDFQKWILLFLLLFGGEMKGINQNLAGSVRKLDLLLHL